MYIRNRFSSMIYKICIAVMCLVGVAMSTGMLNGSFVPQTLLYYTIESNIFCFVFYVASIIFTAVNMNRTGKFGPLRFAPHFKGAVVMSMMLNMVLFFFVPTDNSRIFALIANVLVHFVIPVMVVVDWALFDRKGRFFGSDPIIWMVIPFIYYAVVLVAAQMGVTYGGYSYPYRFLDPDRIRWAPVLVNVFLIVFIYAALGYILFGVDRYLGNRLKKQALEANQYLPGNQAEDEFVSVGNADESASAVEEAPLAASAPVAPAPAMAPQAPAEAAAQKPGPAGVAAPVAAVAATAAAASAVAANIAPKEPAPAPVPAPDIPPAPAVPAIDIEKISAAVDSSYAKAPSLLAEVDASAPSAAVVPPVPAAQKPAAPAPSPVEAPTKPAEATPAPATTSAPQAAAPAPEKRASAPAATKPARAPKRLSPTQSFAVPTQPNAKDSTGPIPSLDDKLVAPKPGTAEDQKPSPLKQPLGGQGSSEG